MGLTLAGAAPLVPGFARQVLCHRPCRGPASRFIRALRSSVYGVCFIDAGEKVVTYHMSKVTNQWTLANSNFALYQAGGTQETKFLEPEEPAALF